MIKTPSLNGNGYLQYAPMGDVSRTTKLEVVLKPSSVEEDALISYAGENQFGSGDYIALLLRDGLVT